MKWIKENTIVQFRWKFQKRIFFQKRLLHWAGSLAAVRNGQKVHLFNISKASANPALEDLEKDQITTVNKWILKNLIWKFFFWCQKFQNYILCHNSEENLEPFPLLYPRSRYPFKISVIFNFLPIKYFY